MSKYPVSALPTTGNNGKLYGLPVLDWMTLITSARQSMSSIINPTMSQARNPLVNDNKTIAWSRAVTLPLANSSNTAVISGVSCFVWTVGPVERILDMSTPRPRREYSAEFRADAVRMVTELGKPRSQVARELELNVSTLGRWVATEIGTLGTGRGSARRAPDPESTDPHEMQREISRLREENEFLKKAAFFAKEQL